MSSSLTSKYSSSLSTASHQFWKALCIHRSMHSSGFPNLLEYICLKYSLILCVYVVSTVTSPFPSLLLFIWPFSLLFCQSWVRSYFTVFLRGQLCIPLTFCIFWVSIYSVCALVCVISVLLNWVSGGSCFSDSLSCGVISSTGNSLSFRYRWVLL